MFPEVQMGFKYIGRDQNTITSNTINHADNTSFLLPE